MTFIMNWCFYLCHDEFIFYHRHDEIMFLSLPWWNYIFILITFFCAMMNFFFFARICLLFSCWNHLFLFMSMNYSFMMLSLVMMRSYDEYCVCLATPWCRAGPTWRWEGNHSVLPSHHQTAFRADTPLHTGIGRYSPAYRYRQILPYIQV